MLGGVLIIPIVAKQFNFVSFIPIYLNVFCLFGLGWILGKILANLFVERSKGNKVQKDFNKEEIVKILGNSSNLNLLVWVQFIFLAGYSLFFLYSFSIKNLSTQDALILFIVGLVTGLMHYSVHPFAQQKAFRILRKQVKEGKYNE